jgi:hypothetical protein
VRPPPSPLLSALAASLLAVSLANTAAAQTDERPQPSVADGIASQAESGAFVPGLSRARNGDDRGVGYVMSGYDGANSSPAFLASVEAVIVSRLALRLGGVYLPSNSTRSMQPQVELRWQLTSQAHLGIDSSVALLYRRDKITQDGGIGEIAVSVGRQFGRTSTIMNIAYGQDDEGDDRLTEVRAAVLRRVRESWVIGASGSASTGWGSSDPRRVARGEVDYQCLVGPSVAFSLGRWALLAQSGYDVIRTTSTTSGLYAFGGVGSTF